MIVNAHRKVRARADGLPSGAGALRVIAVGCEVRAASLAEESGSSEYLRTGVGSVRLRPWLERQAPRRGFTLIELLVIIGIIAVLTSMTIPVISRVRDSARRVSDLSSLRQLTAACIAFAGEHNGLYPQGRVASAPWGKDDYTWINYKACWAPLLETEPGLNSINSCYSVREAYYDADDFGLPEDDYGAPDDTKVGWIYWAGRDDLVVDGKLQYRSMKRQGQQLTPGSQTLWTCWCWDSAGVSGPSICPHVGLNCVIYPLGVALKPPPDGLGVALDDGSASFVHWQDMITIPQANGYKLYYQP